MDKIYEAIFLIIVGLDLIATLWLIRLKNRR